MQIGWAEGTPASPAGHLSSDHAAQAAQAAQMVQTTAHPTVNSTFSSPAPSLHELQALTPSAASEVPAAGSPVPSLSYLQVESSPVARSPSPSSYGFDTDGTGVSSTILATPTGPIFPALTSNTPSAPPPALVPVLPQLASALREVLAPPTSTATVTPVMTLSGKTYIFPFFMVFSLRTTNHS
ncbi:hypothetical protein FS749_010978 [Ceratobasidium sp. UAMH 11750]|nr:hypothetical protein FS749_010978 [Ceratobasidium sp. UAMH 11750]